VFAYYLIAPETIEERIMALLEEKAAMLGQVLDRQDGAAFLENAEGVSLMTEVLNSYK